MNTDAITFLVLSPFLLLLEVLDLSTPSLDLLYNTSMLSISASSLVLSLYCTKEEGDLTVWKAVYGFVVIGSCLAHSLHSGLWFPRMCMGLGLGLLGYVMLASWIKVGRGWKGSHGTVWGEGKEVGFAKFSVLAQGCVSVLGVECQGR